MTRRQLTDETRELLEDTGVPTDWMLGFFDAVFDDDPASSRDGYRMGFNDGLVAMEMIDAGASRVETGFRAGVADA